MTSRALALCAAIALVLAACGGGDGGDGDTAEGGDAMVGLFTVAEGACTAEGATGSTFRMVQPGGTVADGPFVVNGDSPCDDKTWTPLQPGSDGGLLTGAYQPQPDAPFDEGGNAASAGIVAPQPWFAVAFSLSTNERDPQTGEAVEPPALSWDGTALTGDLRALAASWNGQHFNQGAPKPDGSLPGTTTLPTGTFDEDTDAYTLEWTSQIVGGPFNSFTGVWHLEGVFQPDEG